MFNPLSPKHALLGAPLKEIIRRMGPSEEWTDESVMLALYVAGWTAAFNLYPAAALIQAGVRGEKLFSHTTFLRHSPWPSPIFHYTQAASKAERIGGVVGKKVLGKAGVKLGARVGGRLIPGVGWALLAYDVYDIAFNQSLWGFDFA